MVLPDLLVAVSMVAAPAPQSERPPRDLRVEVVDAEGRPCAGVPVGWALTGGEVGWEGRGAKSDEQGLATIPSANRFEFRLYAHDVGFAFPCFENLRVTVAADARLAAPVRLVLPPTRRIEVEIVDGDGRPVDGLGWVSLCLLAPETNGLARGTSGASSPIVAGRAEFPWVGRSGRLGFSGSVGTRSVEAREGEPDLRGKVEIVSTTHSTTRVRVTAGPAGPSIVGRLLRPDGSPAAHLAVEVYESCFSGPARDRSGPDPPIARIETDANGRFRTHVHGFAERAWTVLAVPDGFGGIAAAAPIYVPPPTDGLEESDVGEQSLIEAMLIAAGRAVDEDGRPFGGVPLSARNSRDAPESPDLLESDRRMALSERPHATATRSDGAFEFRTFPPVTRGVISFSIWGRIAEDRGDGRFPLPNVPFGARDVTIKLHRTGTIETSLVLPAGAGATSVSCRCTEPGRPVASNGRIDPISFADDVLLDYVLPGRLDLVLVAAAALPAGAEILRIADVDVPSGRRCDDPRLESIDLTKSLAVRDLRIVGPDGRIVQSGVVYGAPLERHLSLPPQFPIVQGRCRLPIVRGFEEKAVVEIVAPGFAAKVVHEEEFGREIELTPAIVATVSILPWPLACPVDLVATQSLREESKPAHVQDVLTVAAPFWDDNTTEIALPRAGYWELRLLARSNARDRSGTLEVKLRSSGVNIAPDLRTDSTQFRLPPLAVRVPPFELAAIEAFAAR